MPYVRAGVPYGDEKSVTRRKKSTVKRKPRQMSDLAERIGEKQRLESKSFAKPRKKPRYKRTSGGYKKVI